jgi:hypothetical protein
MAKTQTEKKVVINLALAEKVLSVVSKGLSEGITDSPRDNNGEPIFKVGHMCVEAAVAYAIGDKTIHDKPRCVKDWLRSLKININDNVTWDNNKSRAQGLRRLAIAQLGSAYVDCDYTVFWKHVNALLFAESKNVFMKKLEAAKDLSDLYSLACGDDINIAYMLVDTYDEVRESFENLYSCSDEQALMRACELFVQALTLMKIPGTKFLSIAPPPKFKK